MKHQIKLSAFPILTAFFCSLIFIGNLSAQTITATLTGVVTDPNGAVVPSANITVTSNDTGLVKTTVSNDDGRYTVAFLQPGTYTVSVEKQGFARANANNVKLEVAQTASVDINMQVTGGTVDVQVDSDSTPILQTETSNLETTVETKLVEDLPAADRNIFSFVNLVPGTIDSGPALPNNGLAGPIGSSSNRNFFDSSFAVSGGRNSSNEVLLDGVTNTIGDFNGVTVSPPQDAIREFKVISGVAPAEYGRTGGGIVTIASKSGTKKYHGALYEYYQDGNLNANGWLNNSRRIARLNNSSKHQFGGAIGGPLAFLGFGEGVPAFNKFEKTFFFANYELRREKNPFTLLSTVPTAKMRTGDLSELLTGATRAGQTDANGTASLYGQIYNPYGPLVNGKRTAFAGNNLSTLPVCTTGTNRTAACLDPVALAVLQYLPLPNRSGLINNYVFSGNTEFNRDLVSGRIDHTISERQNFFVRFNYEKRYNAPPQYLGSIATPVTVQRDTFSNVTANHVFNISNSVFNNLRYGYTRAHAKQAAPSLGFNPSSLGLPSYLGANAGLLLFPSFTIGGSNIAGDVGVTTGGLGNNQPRDTHMAEELVTWVKSNHTFKFGGEYRLYRFFPFQYAASPTGNFAFSRSATNGPVPSAGVSPVEAAGSAFASFLLGIPSQINRQVETPITVFHHYGAAFAQDDWRITSKLVLNLGLRWDFETPTASPQNLITQFNPEAASPLQGKLNLTNLDAAVKTLNPNISNLTGELTFPKGAQDETTYNRFAPRIGFAYSYNNKTTLRGGVGLFYLPVYLEGTTALGTSFANSQAQTNLSGQVTSSTVFLSNPFPNGIGNATYSTLGNLTSLGNALGAAYIPNKANSYTYIWNLVLQRELAKNLVLDVAYVGSAGRNLPSRNIELNQISNTVLDWARANASQPNSCGSVSCTSLNANSPVTAFLTQQVANPFAGLSATYPNIPASFNGATIARGQLLRRFPQYTSVSQISPKIGFSNYHALQLNLQKRFSDGFSLLANYTWSKLLDTGGVGANAIRSIDPTNAEDPTNFENEYSYSTFDVPHRVTASFTYELPFGKGKWIGSDWGWAANTFLGGWQISGTGVWQRGTPVTITNATGFAATGLGAVLQSQIRPSVVSGVDPMPGSYGDRVRQGLSVFDPAAFAAADVNNYYFGNAARTYNNIRRDNYKNFDLSLIKNFAFSEGRQKIQFRAEAFNVFNIVVFGSPVASYGSATFGQVTTLGNRPRIIQLVGRYTF